MAEVSPMTTVVADGLLKDAVRPYTKITNTDKMRRTAVAPTQ
jgi:hypothetical protein